MELPLFFPTKGVNKNYATGGQPPDTARDAKNVRLKDPITLRERGAQRAGLSRLVQQALGAGPVRDLNQIVTDVPRVIYDQRGTSNANGVLEVWSTAPERDSSILAITTDLDGHLYVLSSTGSILILSAEGELEQSFPVIQDATGSFVGRIVIDEIGGILVVIAAPSIVTKVCRVRRVSEDRGRLDLHWTKEIANLSPFDFDERDGFLYVTGTQGGAFSARLVKLGNIFSPEPDELWNVEVSTTHNPLVVRIGGQGAAYLGLEETSGLPPGRAVTKWYPNGTKAWATDAVGGGLGLGLAITAENDVITCGAKVAGVGLSGLDESNVVIRKLVDLGTAFSADEHTAATGTLTLTLPGAPGETFTIDGVEYVLRASVSNVANEVLIGATPDLTATNLQHAIRHTGTGGEYGTGTVLHPTVHSSTTGAVLTLIAKERGGTGNTIAMATTMAGATLSGATLSGGADNPNGFGAWTGTDPADIYTTGAGGSSVDMALDSAGDVYAGCIDLSGVTETFEKRGGTDGYTILQHRLANLHSLAITNGLALAIPEPIYHTTSVSGPRFVYLATNADTESRTIHRVEIMRLRHDAGASAITRKHVGVGVCAGNIVTFDLAGGPPTVPDGGTGVIEVTSPYPQSAVILGKMYFLDGVNYWEYDPEGFDETPRRDTVTEWKADKGQMPENCRLLAPWNDMAVLARPTDNPHQWFLSAKGKPRNWLFFTVDQLSTDAVIGTDSRAGACPDVINAIIPWTRDWLLFGGDHTLHVLAGHPRVNGYFDLISNSTGIAFGSPWCQDPSGNIYFFGSRGGVWVLAGGNPVDITEQNINADLLQIDLAAFKPLMVWNTELGCLHLFFASHAGNASGVRHWCWEARRGWWPDEFSNGGLEPTAVAVFDGDDPNDRKVVIGCADGVVRFVDRNAVTDDGYKIESYIDLGPFTSQRGEMLWKAIRAVFDSRQDGADYEVYVGDEPDNLKRAASGRFGSGANEWRRFRARGSYVVLRIFNAAPAERWALEDLLVEAEPLRVRRVIA